MNAVRSSYLCGMRKLFAGLFSVLLAASPAQATTPISDNPLILNVTAAPNVLMVLDNSGLDALGSLAGCIHFALDFEPSCRCRHAAGRLRTRLRRSEHPQRRDADQSDQQGFYNPNVTYRRWTLQDGTQYDNSDPTNAKRTPRRPRASI
jgi:type IV pilus assembly protein PilY1